MEREILSCFIINQDDLLQEIFDFDGELQKDFYPLIVCNVIHSFADFIIRNYFMFIIFNINLSLSSHVLTRFCLCFL